MTTLLIDVPASLQTRVAARLADGDYVDAGDYLRDLIRRDLAAVERRDDLRALIQEGLASGVCEEDAATVIRQIIDEDPDLRD